jgi:mannose-6-phosphate isomerase-like protein (cupin superfamily)
MHHHRSEHWVVVQGTAKVTMDGKEYLLAKGESTFVPIGSFHRLENPGLIPLEIIEVQIGDHISEQDIVRVMDDYQRVDH